MKSFFTSIILLLIGLNVQSQFIEETGYNRYEYNGETYKKQDLELAFVQGSKSQIMFSEAKKLRTQTRKVLNAALISFLAGNTLILASSDQPIPNNSVWVGAIFGYLLPSAMILVAIPYGMIARQKFRKSFKQHRFDYYEIHGYQKDQTYLDIGITPNGVGFVFTF